MNKKISQNKEIAYDVLLKIIWRIYELEENDKVLSCTLQNSLNVLDSEIFDESSLTKLLQYCVLLEGFCSKNRMDLVYLIEKYTKKLLELTKAVVDKKRMDIKIKLPYYFLKK